MGTAADRRGGATRSRGGRDAGGRLPRVSIIGAGRLGTALARALTLHGYSIEAVVARRASRARRAVRFIAAAPSSTPPHALDASELDKLPACDLLFITTPDDAIAATAADLAEVF